VISFPPMHRTREMRKKTKKPKRDVIYLSIRIHKQATIAKQVMVIASYIIAHDTLTYLHTMRLVHIDPDWSTAVWIPRYHVC
jgi:hypothetical protein